MARRKRGRRKSNAKTITPVKPVFNWAEVDAPGGIVTKSGKRITGKVLVPDGIMGYGDQESLALMAGDTVARVSTDSGAGDRAYEAAREQADQDQEIRRRKVRNQKKLASIPAAVMSFDEDSKLWDLEYLKEDEGGLVSSHRKVLTDQEAGNLFEQYAEKQLQKDE